MHFGIKVLLIFNVLNKSKDYLCRNNLYLVKVSAENFKISNFVVSMFILINFLNNNENINYYVFK